jgi:hypothetical protein
MRVSTMILVSEVSVVLGGTVVERGVGLGTASHVT